MFSHVCVIHAVHPQLQGQHTGNIKCIVGYGIGHMVHPTVTPWSHTPGHTHTPSHPLPRGKYASYWNAFLLSHLSKKKNYVQQESIPEGCVLTLL